jgi:formamidopyrimidine-DNA glycosylase
MPELPDLTVYVDALRSTVVGTPLERIHIRSPFVLRSVEPPPGALEGRIVRDAFRMGKRIVLALDLNAYLVIHLMIAGRLRWREAAAPARAAARSVLAEFQFPTGSLVFTEAGSKKRASLAAIAGEAALRALDPGGLEPLTVSLDELRQAVLAERHTLKRTLTDPRLFSGIGNAYSDEILHAARLSPLKQSHTLSADEMARLHAALQHTLHHWIDCLRREAGGRFPDKVTAFREGMAVHGRYGQPCPTCRAPIQRIVYAANECNYCAACQNGGRILADRALSRLLK